MTDRLQLPDAPYIADRLARGLPCGVLATGQYLDGIWRAELAHEDPDTGIRLLLGEVSLDSSIKYQTGADAIMMLGDQIGPDQKAIFSMYPAPLWFHWVRLREYYGVQGKDAPDELYPGYSPAELGGLPPSDGNAIDGAVPVGKRDDHYAGTKAAQRILPIKHDSKCKVCGKQNSPTARLQRDHLDGNPDNSKLSNLEIVCQACHAKRHARRGTWGKSKTAKAKWGQSYTDALPDAAFLHIEAGGEKDEMGLTAPRNLRVLPFKDARGEVDLDHLRAGLEQLADTGLPADSLSAVSEKSEAILATETEAQEAKAAHGHLPLDTLPNDALAGLWSQLVKVWDRGELRADQPSPLSLLALAAEAWDALQKHGAPSELPEDPALLVQVRQWIASRWDEPTAADPAPAPALQADGQHRLLAKIRKFKTADDPEWLYVFSLVLQPNDGKGRSPLAPDTDDEIYAKELVRKLAFLYQTRHRDAGIMHEGGVIGTEDAELVQSYVVDDGFKFTDADGKTWPEGAWFIGWMVRKASPLGKAIEAGKINAFSIDGLAAKKPEAIAA